MDITSCSTESTNQHRSILLNSATTLDTLVPEPHSSSTSSLSSSSSPSPLHPPITTLNPTDPSDSSSTTLHHLSPVHTSPKSPATSVATTTTPAHLKLGHPVASKGSSTPAHPLESRDTQVVKHRKFALSLSTLSSSPTRTGGFFALAAFAREKTSTAFASLTEPRLRTRQSTNSLQRSAVQSTLSSSQTQLIGADITSDDTNKRRPGVHRLSSGSEHGPHNIHAKEDRGFSGHNQSSRDRKPSSKSYAHTIQERQNPIDSLRSRHRSNSMHQTSSRLLRMTDDERPFTRDFSDLFATLIVSLPLAPHRVRLTRIDHSFVSEEAINNLGSLKFSQSNRMPDPKDPSRIVTTTTTTTFSMAKEMARSVCQRFLEARFIESADGRQSREFTMRGSVWQLTPKGIHILDRFCARNGIQQKHTSDLINSGKNTMQLVLLERDAQSDKLSQDRSTVEVIFRRFIGTSGPNIKPNTAAADADSLSEYKDGLLGVRMASERKLGSPPRTVFHTFTGRAAVDWLMDCCTVVDRRETCHLAALFIDYDLMWCVQPDRQHMQAYPQDTRFQPTKNAFYQITPKGKMVLDNVTSRPTAQLESTGIKALISRDSNTQKLEKVLTDPALRLLFRENLRDTHCEENLSFYLDVDEFLRACKGAIKTIRPGTKTSPSSMDAIKETMASAYGIYNAFLAPGSPCELNIDHTLRNQLATRMTKAVGVEQQMIDSLKEVTKLFEEAQVSVFKLMASDSVPKFMKNQKYEQTLKNYDFDSIGSSRANTSTTTTKPARS